MKEELDQLTGAIVALLLLDIFRIRIWHLQHLAVLGRRFLKLRLEIFELHGRDQKANTAITVVALLILVSLVIDCGGHYRVHRKNRQLFYPGNMEFTPKNDLSNRMNVIT